MDRVGYRQNVVLDVFSKSSICQEDTA